MSEVLQTNLFFVITSISVVVVTILIGVMLYHIIRILRSVREIIDRLKKGSEVLAEDAASIHGFVKEGVVGTIMGVFGGTPKKKKTTRKKKQVSEE